MKAKSTWICLVALAATLAVAGVATAAMVGIYRNGMDTTAQRAQLIKLSGKECARGGSEEALRVTLGKATPECAYRTPVIGRNIEVGATARLLSSTPKKSQQGAYLGLVARAGGDARYAMLVFPLQRKVQLVKITAGGAEYLAVARNQKAVKGANQANALRLQVVETAEKGKVQVVGYLGSAKVAEATDEMGGELTGQFNGILLGAVKNGNGVVGSFDDVIVRVPVRF